MYNIDLNKQTRSDIYRLIFCYMVSAISLYLAIKMERPDIFSRSGSIMVIMGVISEFYNFTLQNKINEIATKGAGTVGGGVGPLLQPKSRQVIIIATHITIILGTLLWAYGDVFIPM